MQPILTICLGTRLDFFLHKNIEIRVKIGYSGSISPADMVTGWHHSDRQNDVTVGHDRPRVDAHV